MVKILLFVGVYFLFVKFSSANDTLLQKYFPVLHQDSVWIKKADVFEEKLKKITIQKDEIYKDSVLFDKETATYFLLEAGLDSFILDFDTVKQTFGIDSLGGIITYNSKESLKRFMDKLVRDSDFKWVYLIKDNNTIQGLTLITMYVQIKNKLFEQLNMGSLFYALKLCHYKNKLYLYNFN